MPHRRPRTRIHRQGANGIKRLARDQQDAAHRPVAGDTQIRQELQAEAVEFGAGKQPYVCLAVAQRRRAVHRQIKPELEETALRAVYETPHQWPGIQITDGRNNQ